MQPHLLFICTAIGFSWAGFVSIFAAEPNLRLPHAAQSTFVTSTFLCALAFAFADRSPPAGIALITCGMMIAFLVHSRLSQTWATFIAAASLAAYLDVAMQ